MHVRLGGRSVAALALAALVLPWSTPVNAEEPPAEAPFIFHTSHTYSVPAGGRGAFADHRVVRTFERPVASVKLYIIAGRADDIGYVGSRLVTSVPGACQNVGTVTGEQDVSDQATISGNNVSFTLRAQENCCCVTGWGSATQGDRADARFRWEVTFANEKTAAITASTPIIPDAARVNAGCVLYRSDLTGRVTKGGQPQAGIALQFKSDRPAGDNFTQPAAPTNANGVATGRMTTRKQGTARISAANSDISTPSPASIVFGAADYETPFEYTGYFIPSESEARGAAVQACGLDRAYPRDFLFGRGVTMQGTGLDTQGRYIQPDYTRNRNENRRGDNTCFRYTDCARGASGRCVQANVSIAVDRTIIPMGASVSLEGYGNRSADDTGGAILGYHIDLFLGAGRAVLQGHTLRQGRIRYLSGGGSCN
jgi:3D (Asp-Asp-Asp) domain-containing protein